MVSGSARPTPAGAWVLAVLCSVALHAQTVGGVSPSTLSPGAKIIETASVSEIAGKPRTPVLWMDHPVLESGSEEYCGTAVEGSETYKGLLRLSLVGPNASKVRNTIEIPGRAVGGSFLLPARLGDEYYYPPRVDQEGRRVPQILYLQDLTGEGKAGQFVLYEFDACGITSGSVFGYQVRSDRVVHYPIDSGTGRGGWSAEQVFSHQPVVPGRWDFTWRPGHGSDEVIHEQMTFDRVRQRFVHRQTITEPPANPARVQP